MNATVMDLSVIRQGGKDPAGLGGWLTGSAGTPSMVILKLEGDLDRLRPGRGHGRFLLPRDGGQWDCRYPDH